MMKYIRKHFWAKVLVCTMILSLLTQIFAPSVSYALTGGPSQPEVQSFMPVSVSDMVDLSSGDFHYNIPLLQVGDYPINLIYNSGISTDQESSWVGLGWNINPGVINRQMRSVPDDFRGDKISSTMSMKDNKTYGLSIMSPGLEFTGFSIFNLNYSLGLSYNNYIGMNFSQTIGIGVQLSDENSGDENELGLMSLSSGLDGPMTVRADISLKKKGKKWTKEDVQALKRAKKEAKEAEDKKKEETPENDTSEEKPKKSKKSTFGKATVSGNGALSLASYLMNDKGYTPTVNHPMNFTPISLRIATGPGIFLIDGMPVNLSGFYNKQKVKKQSISRNAFGYDNLQYANKTSLMDYHRDNDVAYKRTNPFLPNPVMDYDSYVVNGQGVGGTFRPFRSDFGSLHPAYVSSGSVGGSLGIEVEIGNLLDLGFDAQVNTSSSTTGMWSGMNDMADVADFTYKQNGSLYEPSYSKFLGEIAFDSELENLRNYFLDDKPARIQVTDVGKANAKLESPSLDASSGAPYFSVSSSPEFTSTSYPKRSKRVKRESMISKLESKDVPSAGLTGWVNPNAEGHHIGEITVTKETGSRYVYGRPAYNIYQRDLQFNVSGQAHQPDLGVTNYSSSTATTMNSNGNNEMFHSKTLPPYAHSYLITAVLSNDYVDSDGIRGPSKNDYGSYTLFNYYPAYTYRWKTPNNSTYDSGSDSYDYKFANLSRGALSRNDDDMGSIVEGRKEIHYLREIKSKNQIAVFTVSGREDSKEADGGNETMRKLERIDLYSLPEYEEDYLDATPIKSVHFVYNYKLCGEIYNSSTGEGKLTLEKMYFTYGKSDLSALNAYQFEYEDFDTETGDVCEPIYHPLAYDIWGNYKPTNAAVNPGGVYNSEYPYVDQSRGEEPVADQWARAWALKRISLPTGGIIEIDTEADQYTHVQDKKAMQMVQVLGVSNNTSFSSQNILYSANNRNLHVHFEIPEGSANQTDQNFIDQCVTPLQNSSEPIYFNFAVDVLNNGQEKDRVKGYFTIEDAGVSGSGKGWIKINEVELPGGIASVDAHPVSFASCNYAKLHHPKKAYGFPEQANGGNALDWLITLANASIIGQALQNMAVGPDVRMLTASFGRVIEPERSWFRVLANPNGKYGGGSRVKEIRIIDNWNAMTNDGGSSPNRQAVYGQKYSYALESNKDISSGVASFEPQSSQENPFILPIYYKERRALTPGQEFYVEGPIGRSFYPSPKVTYSRVKVESIYKQEETPGNGVFNDADGADIQSNGYTVSEFYTSKDFPTKSSATPVDRSMSLVTNLIGKLFSFYTFNWESASQGYYVETNDMDGKLKAQSEYNADGVLMTRTENHYQVNEGGDAGLDNRVLVVNDDLSVNCEDVGIDFELYHDFNENESLANTVGLQPNLGNVFIVLGVISVPSAFPDVTVHQNRLRTASTMKVMHRHGILKEVHSYNQGAAVVTKNLAYDAESGEVILSSYTNEYGEEHFSFAYPAHWKYPRMGGAYENEGLKFEAVVLQSPSSAVIGDGAQFLKPGDEVVARNVLTNEKTKAWVYKPDDSFSYPYLIDRNGESINTSQFGPVAFEVEVIRSGNRNMQGMAMGSITMLHNPLGSGVTPSSICEGTGSGSIDLTPSSDEKILQASASTFKEDWKTFAGFNCEEENYNCGSNLSPGLISSEILWPVYNNWMIRWLPILNKMLPYLQPGTNVFTASTPPFDLDPMAGFYTWANHSPGDDQPNYFENQDITWSIEMEYLPDGQLEWSLLNNGSPISSFLHIDNAAFGTLPNSCFPDEPLSEDAISLFQDIGCISNYLSVPNNDFGPFFQEQSAILVAETTSGQTKRMRMRASHTSQAQFFNPIVFVPVLCSDLGQQPISNINDPINPYVLSTLGNWRLEKEWAYKGKRVYNYDAQGDELTNVREDGYFDTAFSPFWDYSSLEWNASGEQYGWIASRYVSEYSPYSTEVENIDPLNRYSSAVFGYNHKLPICMGNNASYQRIGFDSFEDYDYYEGDAGCFKRHFAFDDYSDNVTQSEAHTGYHSIRVPEAEEVRMTRTLEPAPIAEPTANMPYIMQAGNDIGLFGPETYDISEFAGGITSPPSIDVKYIISYWVREIAEGEKIAQVSDFTQHDIEILAGGSAVSWGDERRSPIIDGWQRIEREFTISGGTSGDIEIALQGSGDLGSPTGNPNVPLVYVDDIRVHPFNSSFKSFTYDYRTLRLMAELDENNFATLYEYDPEGNLVRLKKETERGIMTIKEYRKDLPFSLEP